MTVNPTVQRTIDEQLDRLFVQLSDPYSNCVNSLLRLLENYRLLQERQPEIGGTLSCQRMLAYLLNYRSARVRFEMWKQRLPDSYEKRVVVHQENEGMLHWQMYSYVSVG